MIKKEIMRLMCEKLDMTRQRIYQIVNQKKKQHKYTISRETAAYILAAEEGIDISQYLSEEELAKVRDATGMIVAPSTKMQVVKKHIRQPLTVEIAKEFKIVDPYLPKKLINEAAEMAKVYPVVYLFENSIRNLIRSVMGVKHGKDWWNTKVSRRIRENVQNRKAREKIVRWHGKRGAHPIFYTDIDDLKSIITTNWSDFHDIFPKLSWVTNTIDVIEVSRNVVAHNNPLSERDIDRLKLFFEDWLKQVSEWHSSKRT